MSFGSRLKVLPALGLVPVLLSVGLGHQRADHVSSTIFAVEQVAPGVWALIAKPATPSLAVSNAAIIELGDKVLVVDSHLSPSAAREAARIVSAVSGNKPVRYLVNSHWHPDHVQGNSTYSSSFPGMIDIISHANTRRDIVALELPFLKDQKAALPIQIAEIRGRIDSGVVSDEQKGRLELQLAQAEALYREIRDLEITLPDLTLDRSMTLHSGDREVRILYFGRGHTEGDVVVFLPSERVLVTGDLLTNSIPFMRDAFPLEWSATLAGVEKLDFDTVIPGHGEVQQGKERLKMLRAFLDDLVPAVRRAVAQGKSLDEAKKTVKSELAPRHERNFPSWNGGAEAAIERAYIQITGKK
jgi:glyoxylase-like metal-dependent hydrolase (beta-lactamase superfamily II)